MPAPSTSFVRRAVSILLGFTLLALLALPACGRSNLDDYLLSDAGPTGDGPQGDVVHDGVAPDNAACNATTCPSGCCDATGVCRAGSTITQCGALGETCQDCATEGFQLCDPTHHACGNTVVSCDPGTCSGCCEGNLCLAGTDPNECGLNGQSCLHCAATNLACSPQQTCVQPACGPQTCIGCCFGDQCLSGTDPAACGIQGAVCGNCLATGGKCVAEGNGGVCEGATTCNASNCPGCCSGNTCLPGFEGTDCGFGGQQCGNCQGMGGQCVPVGQGGACEMQGGCSPENCPGCCAGNACLPGTDPNECGISGQACESCVSFGGVCVSQGGGSGGFCESSNFCGPQTCQGCCEGNNCLPGGDPTACGSFGEFCTDCTQFGETCTGFDAGFGQQCGGQVSCNAQNCPGCCAGNTCLVGNDPAACGSQGQLCADCTSKKETCSTADAGFGGGSCVTEPPPVCNAMTCPTGCCDGALCLPGNLDSFCGTAGAVCANCGAAKKTCTAQACVGGPPTCNASNCQGCCDQGNNCQPGFVDTQCGESGASCQDCTVIMPSSTCDVSVTPRLCQDQQVQCPAPYPSCPASLETPSPVQQTVCSQSDLQNAAAACEGGAHSAACDSFFAFEKSQNPSCASCLTPFDYDFSELTGLTTCVAPFTDATCNHITACLVDCTDKSCAQCVDSGALQACQNEVPNSVCSSYYTDAQCIDNAFFGPGSFCDPNQGDGLFGDWLLPVGQYYCGSGGFGADAGSGGGFGVDAGGP